MVERLDEAVIRARLASLPGWRFEAGSLERELIFADFVAAFGFLSRAALVAERTNHHPRMTSSYRHVWLSLSTHEAQGVSERDFALAEALERLL